MFLYTSHRPSAYCDTNPQYVCKCKKQFLNNQDTLFRFNYHLRLLVMIYDKGSSHRTYHLPYHLHIEF